MLLTRGGVHCELCNEPASLHEGFTVACTRGMLLARGRPRPTRRDTHLHVELALDVVSRPPTTNHKFGLIQAARSGPCIGDRLILG